MDKDKVDDKVDVVADNIGSSLIDDQPEPAPKKAQESEQVNKADILNVPNQGGQGNQEEQLVAPVAMPPQPEFGRQQPIGGLIAQKSPLDDIQVLLDEMGGVLQDQPDYIEELSMELMEEHGKIQLAGNSEGEVMEAIFKVSEFLHFYIAKVKNK